jgi:hypothetical protein
MDNLAITQYKTIHEGQYPPKVWRFELENYVYS